MSRTIAKGSVDMNESFATPALPGSAVRTAEIFAKATPIDLSRAALRLDEARRISRTVVRPHQPSPQSVPASSHPLAVLGPVRGLGLGLPWVLGSRPSPTRPPNQELTIIGSLGFRIKGRACRRDGAS